MVATAKSMSETTCGDFKLCAWKHAQFLSQHGSLFTARDLCIAIDDSGDPCSKRATFFFQANDPIDDSGSHPSQPFCDRHARHLIEALDRLIIQNSTGIVAAAEAQAAEQKRRTLTISKPEKEKGFVYFILVDDRIKIGYSTDVEKRVATLQTASGSRFETVTYRKGGRAMEARYHRRWADQRLSGEWFTATPELLAEMAHHPPLMGQQS